MSIVDLLARLQQLDPQRDFTPDKLIKNSNSLFRLIVLSDELDVAQRAIGASIKADIGDGALMQNVLDELLPSDEKSLSHLYEVANKLEQVCRSFRQSYINTELKTIPDLRIRKILNKTRGQLNDDLSGTMSNIALRSYQKNLEIKKEFGERKYAESQASLEKSKKQAQEIALTILKRSSAIPPDFRGELTIQEFQNELDAQVDGLFDQAQKYQRREARVKNPIIAEQLQRDAREARALALSLQRAADIFFAGVLTSYSTSDCSQMANDFSHEYRKILYADKKPDFTKHHYKYYKVFAANLVFCLFGIGLLIGVCRGFNFKFFDKTTGAKRVDKTVQVLTKISKFFSPVKPRQFSEQAEKNRPLASVALTKTRTSVQ
jgi:hypothetical protein